MIKKVMFGFSTHDCAGNQDHYYLMESEEEPRHKDADRITSVMRKLPDIVKKLTKLESLKNLG